MVKDNKNLIVGLDIGTSKIVAIVSELTPEKRLNIIGLGTQPSRGLKKGVVVNIDQTVRSITDAVSATERPWRKRHSTAWRCSGVRRAMAGSSDC